MTLDLTKEELDLVVQLMDLGVKAVGIQAVRPELLAVVGKISAAVNAKPEVSPPAES